MVLKITGMEQNRVDLFSFFSILEVSYSIQLARGIKVQTDHREQLIL